MRDEPAPSFHSGWSGRVRPEERLARWGARQHRLVTAAQLAEVGWSSSVIAKRVGAGRLHPVHAEVHSLGGPPRTDRERWTNHCIGGDEVDVYLPDHRAVIEVQSELHANPAARKHDAAKQRRLEARGLEVLELW